MLPSTKKNKQTSSDENESEGNEENNDLESSYELFTPSKLNRIDVLLLNTVIIIAFFFVGVKIS